MAPLQEGSISSTLAGTQDTRWGSPTSLEGELGAVAIFHEALQAAALRVLCALGMQRAPHAPPQPYPCSQDPRGWVSQCPGPKEGLQWGVGVVSREVEEKEWGKGDVVARRVAFNCGCRKMN